MHLPKTIASGAVLFLCLARLHANFGDAENDPLRVDLSNQVTLELVEIAPGTFQEGSPAGEPGHRADEQQHEVRLTKKFYLGKTPVTRAQYARFVQDTGYTTEAEAGVSGGYGWNGNSLEQRPEFNWRKPGFPQTDADPVTLVTFNDAQAFIGWLTQKSGRDFTLPTEAQWEYASRAGATTAWPAGNTPADGDAAAWNKANAGNGTHPVGQKPANAWGLSDMLGNVWEWCEDWYGPYETGPGSDPMQTNPRAADKPRRVLRGGSWMRSRLDCRFAARYRNDPASRNADNGFRVMTFASQPNHTAALPSPAAGADLATHASNHGAPLGDGSPAPDQFAGADRLRNHPSSTAQANEAGGVARADFGPFFVFVLFAAIIATLARLVFRRTAGISPGVFGTQGRFSIRVMDDGFWITGNGIPPGTPLFCRYDTPAGEQDIQVNYEPGPDGQFVYTGIRPGKVTVTTSVSQSAVPYSRPGIQNYSVADPLLPPPVIIDPGPNLPPGPPPAY